MKNKKFQILKSSGYPESFSRRKLLLSLKRSGLPNKQCQKITDEVANEVDEGSNTRSIYQKTLRLVNQSSSLAAVNYSLKRAIFDLGPAGHFFEAFVGRYFQELGYTTKTCQVLQGRFVTHEVDVVATRKGKDSFVECKFHNRSGIKNDIKIALYVKARRDDLRDGPAGKNLKYFYVASNTAFTLDAIKYSKGSDIHLLGINTPVEHPFIEEVRGLRLYPVTRLRSINRHYKLELLKRDIILAKELTDNVSVLEKMGFTENEINKVLDEVELLTQGVV